MTATIILAAGGSTRLGRAKQTLPFQNKSLLQHSIDTAVGADIGAVIVVIGANEEEIGAELKNQDIRLLINNHWIDGMATSIKEGITAVIGSEKAIDNIILMVCDQPYVHEQLLQTMVHTRKTSGKTIVACSYKDTVGVPALFDRVHFAELLALKGDEGGKKLLKKRQGSVAIIPFAAGAVDIDTEQDYEALNK
ncbi:MAG: nucleotidyltransferase family protein [Bacteroidota bacterium]|nr:nucleotidyltransferase family protein [Bacteroidota bacterium]